MLFTLDSLHPTQLNEIDADTVLLVEKKNGWDIVQFDSFQLAQFRTASIVDFDFLKTKKKKTFLKTLN